MTERNVMTSMEVLRDYDDDQQNLYIVMPLIMHRRFVQCTECRRGPKNTYKNMMLQGYLKKC